MIMSPTVVYVLILDGTRFLESLMVLSLASLKEFHPNLRVTCFTDNATKDSLDKCASPLLKLVTSWITCNDVSGDSRLRSRMIKISLRRRITGKYLFLDIDTIVVRSLERLLTSTSMIAMAQDQFLGHPYFGFPEWLEPHYRILGWNSPTKRYFNSGVMLVEDCEHTHNLYALWEKCWKCTCAIGLHQDQPALNHAVEVTNIEVDELPLQFNAMIQVDERYRANARILHFFCSKRPNGHIPARFLSEYQRLINKVSEDRPVDGKEIIDKMFVRKALSGTLSWRRQYHAGNICGALELLFRQELSKTFGRF